MTTATSGDEILVCERCGLVLGADVEVAMVDGAVSVEEVPERDFLVATLTGTMCKQCWLAQERPLSEVVIRGRIVGRAELDGFDMTPLQESQEKEKEQLGQEFDRAEALKRQLNRTAVLTFHDIWSGDSVLVHREDWTDPLQVASALVRLVKELRELDLAAVYDALERAGVQLQLKNDF